MNKTVLLIIDVQKELFNKKIPVYQANAMLSNICQLAARAKKAGAPVVYVQHTNSTMPGDTDGWQLHPALHPEEGDIFIRKMFGSAFEKTPLHSLLSSRGAEEVIITGLVSHGCIQAACLDAVKLGYKVILASDAHSNFHKKPLQVISETHTKLSQAGVVIKSAGEIQFS
jgi:nicotinamidase-related amidase